jgi:hypothetical protein
MQARPRRTQNNRPGPQHRVNATLIPHVAASAAARAWGRR